LAVKSTGDSERSQSEGTVRVGVIDRRHLLLVGAGPGLGAAVARRFASGGYRVTLVARSTDRLGELASNLATLTIAGQIVAGTSFDPARIAERYWEVVQTDGPWKAEFRFTGE